ncbi:MAG: hypothetical protein R3B95_07805 [Nitrospirales bacterium]|nr:hypothetical protein [Nitrospirales bacterium]
MKCVGRNVLCVMVLSVGVGVATVPAHGQGIGDSHGRHVAQIVQSLTSYIHGPPGFYQEASSFKRDSKNSQLASLLAAIHANASGNISSYLNQTSKPPRIHFGSRLGGALIKIVVQSPYGKEVAWTNSAPRNPRVQDYEQRGEATWRGNTGRCHRRRLIGGGGNTRIWGWSAGDLAHIEAYNDGLNQNFSKYAAANEYRN